MLGGNRVIGLPASPAAQELTRGECRDWETGTTYSGLTPNELATWLWIRATTSRSFGTSRPLERLSRATSGTICGSGTKNTSTASVPEESECTLVAAT